VKKTMLVVEDEPRIVEMLTTRLKAAGYRVIPAADAVLAGIMAVKHHPDLVLLDISMPGGNGLMVAERLQNVETTASIPEPGFQHRNVKMLIISRGEQQLALVSIY
jgi:DNA-binding response OmpR family regulator